VAASDGRSRAGFHHVAIAARDFDRSLDFYRRVLGFAEVRQWKGKEGHRAAMLDTGDGSLLEVFERPAWDAPREGSILHFALRCAEPDVVIERVRDSCAVVTMEPKDITIASDPPLPARIAFFKGPDGEIIELFREG
jgi:glyoxylase I family protein